MTIKVHTRFVLTRDDSRQTEFRVGEHRVSDEIASHWYVRAHSEPIASHPESRQSLESASLDAPAAPVAPSISRKAKTK